MNGCLKTKQRSSNVLCCQGLTSSPCKSHQTLETDTEPSAAQTHTFEPVYHSLQSADRRPMTHKAKLLPVLMCEARNPQLASLSSAVQGAIWWVAHQKPIREANKDQVGARRVYTSSQVWVYVCVLGGGGIGHSWGPFSCHFCGTFRMNTCMDPTHNLDWGPMSVVTCVDERNYMSLFFFEPWTVCLLRQWSRACC